MARLKQVLRSATKSGDPYCPEAGDLIYLDFDPQAGREQAGRRLALVLSPRAYNERARLCIVCPVTSQSKGYPFEVALPEGMPINGVILADHLKSLSWERRRAAFIARAADAVATDVRAKIAALLRIA